MNGLDPAIIALLGLIYLAGGVVKGSLGFGLPLVTISISPFFIPVELALAFNSVVLLATNAVQVWRAGETREAFAFSLPILAGVAVTTLPGVWIATQLPANVLLGALGCLVLTFSILSFFSVAIRLPSGGLGAAAIGGVAGVVGAFSSAPGPVFVMYLMTLGLPRRRFMAVIGILMGLVGTFLTAGFVIAGVLDLERLALGALLFLPGTLGFVLGDRLFRRFPEKVFRRGVLIVLVILALAMIRRAFA